MDVQADHKRKRTDEEEKVNKRPRTANHKRKRVDEGKRQKRQRTTVIDETFQFQLKNVDAGGHPRKEKRKEKRRPESSKKREVGLIKDDNKFDRLTEASVDDEARKIHAMQRLMSVVDGLMFVVDSESKPGDEISLTNETECYNKIHDKIVDLRQKVVELKRRSSLKKREANWSELPNELLESILKKLIPSKFDVNGFRHIREFKAVCQSWRAAAKSCSSYVPLPQTPCLLLHGERQKSILFDPIEKKKHEIRNVHDYYPWAECIGSSYGWIVMFYEDNELKEPKSKAQLFNPITRGRISIPGITQALDKAYLTPTKAIISSNPSFNKNFVVVVQFGLQLAYYKHGDEDKCWKMLEVNVNDADGHSANYYYDKGFVFHNDLLVASSSKFTNIWDFKEYPPLHRSSTRDSSTAKYYAYLTTSSLTGDILRLTKEGEDKSLKFDVEKLDLRRGKWENLQSLGDQSLFLFCFSNHKWQLMPMTNPCFLGCEKNSIYFATRELNTYVIYDYEKGKVKSSEEGMMKLFVNEDVRINFGVEPLWIIPNPW